ncbi:MAG: endonuclease/exonuclease/phosphatase family protein [Gemmatimonadota bacterium]|nr:MAG: endonuclease/exonuclease/phosphatase family protein [Gemmatimonadota bacterium]
MNGQIGSARRACIVSAAGALLFALLTVACSEDRVTGPTQTPVSSFSLDHGTDVVTVMNHNIYVGANVDRVIDAEDPSDIPILVALTFQELVSTNFPARAQAIADEIARRQPHLVGLQEVSLIRYQSPSDFFVGNPVPATDVLLNYLSILEAALAARGLDYQVAGAIQNADVELPMFVGFGGSGEPLFDDVRLTDFDVVLVRGDVDYSNVAEVNYQAQYAPFPEFGIIIPRGYVAIDATIKPNHTYRFVNTHLESDDQDVKESQAAELIAALESERKPVILVGDLNTPAPDGAVYQMFLGADYIDAWTRNHEKDEGDGLTNGHDSDLRNTEVNFTKRIDFILVRNRNRGTSPMGPAFATVWGDELGDRVPSGLPDGDLIWPSDHAAVIAEMRIPILGAPAYAAQD